MANFNVANIARDLGRAFRERPAIVIGGAVIGLIGISALSRGDGQAEEATDEIVDPLAGLFPGVDTWGSGIPGSGSVPWAGYPVAGDGSYVAPPPPAPPVPTAAPVAPAGTSPLISRSGSTDYSAPPRPTLYTAFRPRAL
jgi:hypothetical protein